MPSRLYSREVLEPVVINSRSFRDLTIRLGKKPHGGLINHIKKIVIGLGIDCSHFNRGAWNKGVAWTGRRSAEEIFSGGKIEPAYRLKRALLEIGREWSCEVCGIKDWMGKEIDFEIHHIDGDKKNNTIVNLRIVCPNCHSQSGNSRFKGRKHG